MDTSKVARVETLEQARTFDRIASRYRKAGLCDTCAAQAAYGHQLGFSKVHRPCTSCEAQVALYPTVRVNGWRSFPRGDRAET